MRWFSKLMLFAALVALIGGVMVSACTQDEDDEEESKYETVPIEVTVDELFDLSIGDQIGVARFRSKKGPTGLRVRAECYLETLSRFPDQKIDVKLELLNQDAAHEPMDPVEWVQDSNTKSFSFIIPVVETIPSILNFRVLVYSYIYSDELEQTLDDDTADDDTVDDDITDDDATDDDTADDDATDDDTSDDDDDDDEVEPEHIFEAEGIFLFVVNEGAPGTGD
ncbi:MAG TPA: hypothetical protein PKW95_13070 [bacterium]|nr:hypothetical protein [bacterium]